MKNIVLIGMMGCGKTTVGNLLAQALGREPVDTDSMIEEREGRTVADIFAADGEDRFRSLELSVSRELGRQEDLVISCGGGLPMQEGCMAALRERGLVFWLDRDPAKTYDSLDISGRPLAQSGRADFLSRYARRSPVYARWAHHVISDPPSAQAAARAIIAILEREEHQA